VRFCGNFLAWWDPVFAGGFGKNVVVERGFLVVKLWWINGESWEVDGQDSGSKKMPLSGFIFEGFPFCDWVASTNEKAGRRYPKAQLP
jgi:hypothetical protein